MDHVVACCAHTHTHNRIKRYFPSLRRSRSHAVVLCPSLAWDYEGNTAKKKTWNKLLRISIAPSASFVDVARLFEFFRNFVYVLRVINNTQRAQRVICFLLVITVFLFSLISCFRNTAEKLRRTKTESCQFDRNRKKKQNYK